MKKIIYTLVFCCFASLITAQNFGLRFNGSDSKVELCNSEDFNVGEDFTIEAWINAVNWRAEAWRGSIVTKDGQGPDSGFAFRAGKNGTLSFVLGVGAWPEVQTNPFMNANQWYHVAAVKKGNTLMLYINGNLSATGNATGEPVNNMLPVTIGDSPGFPGRAWDGFIDEVRIWNTARSSQELADNQTSSLEGNEPGLITYLPMNEGSGSILNNLTDGACNGTLINLDDASWVEGFSIPEQDVGVAALTAPDVLAIFNRPVKIRAELQNFGSETISNIPVEVSINGIPTFTETFNVTIQPGEIVEVVFDRIVDLTDNNTNLLTLSTRHPEDNNSLNDEGAIRYRRPQDDRIVNILNDEQFNFAAEGQTKFTQMNLPENVEDFEQLLLHISVDCPNTGCDPWDQPARVSVETDEGSIEIARFITPFGRGCGPWTVDVTDFKSILKGNVNFKSFVQVWGPSGWLTNIDLEYVGNADTPEYTKISTLWATDNWVYGDPGVSDDLEELNILVDDNTQSNHLRMTISGHGQGNTNNAAEFSNVNHTYVVNQESIEVQNLWKSDCDQNSCANQLGTWTLSRAGWCPGQAVEPFILNLTGITTPGENVSLDYELEDYTNALNTGYDGGGHTEPHYRIFSYFIESSENRFEDFTNLRAERIAIVTNGDVNNPVLNSLDFTISNNGTVEVSNPNVAYFVNEEFVFDETISATIAPGETYTHSFSQLNGFDFSDDNLVFAVVNGAGDQNLNDDATKSSINENLVNVSEIEPSKVNLSPNPSSGEVNISVADAFLNGEIVVIDILGRTIAQKDINTLNTSINIEEKGVYFFNFRTEKGTHRTEKIVIE